MSQRTRERYRIEEQIGSGGMASVYRAMDTVLQRSVALKVLNKQADPALKERFQAEAQAVAQLNHPNIVNVYDVGEMDGEPSIVMEYVRGTNLKRLIEERGPLPLPEVESVARQVGAALSYAHRNGLVHCDVKPHNILLSPDRRAKLVDFGIAQAQVDRRRRRSEQVYGTPLYIAPEQAAGQPVSPRTDVYGMGLVLWEALTGMPPERPDPAGPVRLPLERARLPRPLAEIIQKATAADPANRYNSVDELTRALQRWRDDAEPAGQQTVAYRPLASPQSRAGTAPPSASTRTVPASRPRAQGRRRLPLLPLAALLLLLLGLGGTALSRGVRDQIRGMDDRLGGLLGAGTPSTVTVPSLLNRPLAEVREVAEGRGLELDVQYDPDDADHPVGTVVDQRPGAGDLVERGSTIEVTIAGDASGNRVPPAGPSAGDTGTPTAGEGDGAPPLLGGASPTATPRARLVEGQTLVELQALDEPVELKVVADGAESDAVLEPGQYRKVQGARVRIEADRADQVRVTVDLGRRRGTLHELAELFCRQKMGRTNPECEITGRSAYIEFVPPPPGESRGVGENRPSPQGAQDPTAEPQQSDPTLGPGRDGDDSGPGNAEGDGTRGGDGEGEERENEGEGGEDE